MPVASRLLVAGLALAMIAATSCRQATQPPAPAAESARAATAPAAQNVGAAVCAGCHAVEASAWKPSQHARAMMQASPASVLAKFAGAFRYNGITSTFSRKGDGFVVSTDGPDGKIHDYPIAYTFGVEPLQQFLVPFPRGRFQALSIAWDSRPAAQGGQRWFHLHPGERVDSKDVLHWTGPAGNWNYMCAECHSTGLEKRYASTSDTYDTRWTDVDVGCESCHGPGSRHVEWARAGAGSTDPAKGLVFSIADTSGGVWQMPAGGSIAKRTAPLSSRAEIETCARCHSRRSQVWPEYRFGDPLAQSHRVSWLEDGLYFADGQQQDEVYNYGSFLQSKMYAAGVTCSNCHNPHSGALVLQGNALCARCHLPGKYDQPSHHFHKSGSAGAACVSCHMPARTYMVIDARRDHAFKVPRPDESVTYGVPNACTGCHTGKSDAWAAAAVAKWYPQAPSRPSWTGVIAAARASRLTNAGPLVQLAQDLVTPAIVRATAVSYLGGLPGTAEAIRRAATDADPMVRRAAAAALPSLQPADRLTIGLPLTSDPVRTVRLEAVMPLAQTPASFFSGDERQRLMRGVDEYRRAQEFNGDRAEAHINLGALEQALGNFDEGRREFALAIARQPQFVPGYLNLAELERAAGNMSASEEALRKGLSVVPSEASLHHALGLALVRQHRAADALVELARASQLAPEDPRYVYVYAVALHDTGKPEDARRALEHAAARMPGNAEILSALASYARERGDTTREAQWRAKLEALSR
jgi:predicted CXXCH cytochrome family protein